ncbi:MAG: hypothetical protein HYZ74_04420 [Elusimicrobia bacterium]|nr:hypothetical protein [Elusimicrobiota bacterium]
MAAVVRLQLDAPLEDLCSAISPLTPLELIAHEPCPKAWVKASARLNQAPSNAHILARSQLVTLAFAFDRCEALPLLEHNVASVHAALARNAPELQNWDTLNQHLPAMDWWRSWDRCEKLRRRVVSMTALRGGTLTAMLKDADAKTIHYFVKTCLATKRGTELLVRSCLDGKLA